MKILLYLIISTIFLCPLFSQSGGSGSDDLLKNASIMIGLNQSFYGEDWKDFEEEIEDSGLDLSKNPFRRSMTNASTGKTKKIFLTRKLKSHPIL